MRQSRSNVVRKTGTRRRVVYAGIVAVLVATAILAAINATPTCTTTGIMPVGEMQNNKTAPDWSLIGDIESFESPDGHTYLLVAGRSDGVLVVNMTNPRAPVYVGNVSYEGLGEPHLIDMEMLKSPDGRIYALLVGDKARILDVTDPQNLVFANNLWGDPPILDDVHGATIFESPDGRTYAWLEGHSSGIRIADMTDPYLPVIVNDGRDDLYPHMPLAVFESPDGHAYSMSAFPFSGLHIDDVTDPHNPTPVAAMRYADLTADYPVLPSTVPEAQVITIRDEYAAGLNFAEMIVTFESSDGRIYAMISNHGVTSTTQGADPRTIPTGILFMDVTDPRVPTLAGYIRNGDDGFDIGSHIRHIKILESSDGHAYAVMAGGRDILVLNVTDPRVPVPVGRVLDGNDGFYAVGIVSGMALLEPSDGIFYLAAVSDEGVQIMDVTYPRQPVPVGTLWDEQRNIRALEEAHYHVVFESDDGHTYALGTGADGVHVVDVTVPHAPVPIGSVWDGKDGFDTLDRANHAAVFNLAGSSTYALVGSAEGIQIMDVADPHDPIPIGSLRDGKGMSESKWITGIAILKLANDQTYALVADHNTGVHIVDVADPSAPVLAGGILKEGGVDILGGTHGIEVYGHSDGRVYALMTGDRGMHVVNVTDPLDPILAGTVRNGAGNYTFDAIYRTAILESHNSRTHVLIVDHPGGLHVVDIADPSNPVPAGNMPVGEGLVWYPGMPVMLAEPYGGHIYALVSGDDGIRILDVTDPRSPMLLNNTLADKTGFFLDTYPRYITPFGAEDGRTYALVGNGDGILILDVTEPYVPGRNRGVDAGLGCI